MMEREPCATNGCYQYAIHTVRNGDRYRNVCRKCMQELVAFFQWVYVK